MKKNIVYEDVWKAFNSQPVIRGVSFNVREGEIVALLGPNGSGKSTLFKMSLGIVKPDKGSVLVDGVDAVSNPIKARQVVGYMPEETVIYESLKLEEYIEFILSVYRVKVEESLIKEIINILELEQHVGKLIGELSHGNKRKVLLATLMLREPPILVLDEVFSGLDPVIARIIKTWLRDKTRRGGAVLVSTHVLPIAEAVADRVLIIHRGEIVAEGKPGELKEIFGVKELEDVFLEVTGYAREYEDLIRELYE
ncbi:MAG: ABC transporter ATP-binding protein [Thermoprotei archaeon]|nr:ABC transporter ATP-binding protein [Thermoproteales archaeon]RLE75581.1 MAG: ABC transporter ATP-binding protein [Thermoprotei archaeon]